jgi:hypothetical protein
LTARFESIINTDGQISPLSTPAQKRNLKTMIHLYGYYMAQTLESYFEFVIAVLLIGIMISVSSSEFTAIISQATAQAPSAGNMTTPMLESTRFHLKAADELITKGDTIAALRQINLAEIQLSLLNMGSQGTSMNSSQAIEFITGGSLSSARMAANCIIDNQAMASCMQ